MKHILLLAACMSLVAVAACDDTRVISTPTPTASPAAGSDVGTGGPCGDGTRLGPNESCP